MLSKPPSPGDITAHPVFQGDIRYYLFELHLGDGKVLGFAKPRLPVSMGGAYSWIQKVLEVQRTLW